LLLTEFSASVLPLLYIAIPFAVGLALLLLAAPSGAGRLALGAFVAAGVLLLCFVLLPVADKPTTIALYLFGEACATVLSIAYWELLGTLFDSRTAMRIFGLIGAAGMAGAVVGGLFVERCSVLLGTRALLPFAAAALFLTGLSALRLARRLPGGRSGWATPLSDPTSASRARGTSSRVGNLLLGFRLLSRSRYPRLIAGLVLLLSVLSVTVDFFFRSRAQGILHDDQLTSVFGLLNLVVGLFAILFQLLVTGRLLSRFHVRGYLLTLLGLIGGLAALGLAGLGFWPIFALKVVESASSLSLSQPAIQLLFHPLPPGDRVLLRGVIDGLLKKLGLALGGLVLFVSLPLAGALVSEVGVLVLLLPGAGLLCWLHREHQRLLDARLRLTFQNSQSVRLGQGTVRDYLEQGLRLGNAGQILSALALVRAEPGFDLAPYLTRLVAHPDAEVRQQAHLLTASREAAALPLVGSLAAEFRTPQLGEVRSLAQLAPVRATALLQQRLRSPDLAIRSEAIESLYPLEPDGSGPAHRLLAHWVVWSRMMAPPAEKVQLAELIGRLRGPELPGLLLQLLKDGTPEVREAAVRAAGRLAHPSLLPPLLEALGSRAHRLAARDALASYGDAVVDLCEQWLNDRSRGLELRLRLPQLLRRIGTARAGRALLFSNTEDDPFLRDRIAGALAALHRAHPEIDFDRQWVHQAVERRLSSVSYYLPVYQELLPYFRPGHLLLRILNDRLLQNLVVLLHLLSLVHPAESLYAIRLRWLFGTRHQRADALNLLERLLEGEQRRRVLELLEAYDRLRDAGSVYATHCASVDGAWEVSAAAVRRWQTAGREPQARRGGSPEAARYADEDWQPTRSSSPLLTLASPRLAAPASSDDLASGARVLVALQAEAPPGGLARLVELVRSRDALLRSIAQRSVRQSAPWLQEAVGPLPPLLENEMPETLMDKVLFLQSVDLFEHQRVDDLVAIASITEEKSFPQGQVIYEEGDPSDALYLILEGEVELFKSGCSILVNHQRESFGQLSMLDRKPRPTTAVARTALRTLSLGRIEFFDLVADRSELLQGLVEVLVRRIRMLLEETVANRT
jgi:hypothetical protein